MKYNLILITFLSLLFISCQSNDSKDDNKISEKSSSKEKAPKTRETETGEKEEAKEKAKEEVKETIIKEEVKELIAKEEEVTKGELKSLSSKNNEPEILPVTRFINHTGELIDLKDYKDKKNVLLVVLRGFAGSVCFFCSTQTFNLMNSVERFERRDTQIIAVYPGKAENIPLFIAEVNQLQKSGAQTNFQLPFPVVLDVDLAFVKQFMIEGALAKPTSILLDKNGEIRFVYIGKKISDRPKVEKLLREIDKIQ